jgi:hypothetical protein
MRSGLAPAGGEIGGVRYGATSRAAFQPNIVRSPAGVADAAETP